MILFCNKLMTNTFKKQQNVFIICLIEILSERNINMVFENLTELKQDLWEYLKNTNKKIVMYGTGNGADKILDVFEIKGIKLYGIFASDDFARGQEFRGFKVRRYMDFKNELDDFIVIVSFASQRDEVLKNIYRIESERELYAPDVPVYGEGLFDIEYFKKNLSKFKNIYLKLSDELSRKTFVSTIAFKLTGIISYLRDCETTQEEENTLISSIIRNKNYVDIGAYTGDTVEQYTNLYGKDMKLYAFEPDSKNYRKMQERFQKNNIVCKTFNAAAWDKNETLTFYSNSGRAGTATKSSKTVKSREVQGVRVDDFVDDRIGFIKIDAEGADVNVLKGLSKTIVNDAPCIKIAAYHRNNDYFTIPEAVNDLNKNFKLYMRHLKYVPAWDTDFIFEFPVC